MADTDNWEPRPGEMHPVDQAFYDLTVKERDFERRKVDRLEAQLAGAIDALEAITDEGRTSLRWRKSTSGGTVEKPNVRIVARRALDRLRGQSR